MRDMKTIQTEYQSTCIIAGQLQYQIHASERELKKVNDKLQDLNKEANKLQEAQQASAAAEAAQAPTKTPEQVLAEEVTGG